MRKSPQPHPDSSTFGPDEYWEKIEANTALSLPFLQACRVRYFVPFLLDRFPQEMQDDLGGSYQSGKKGNSAMHWSLHASGTA
jgi:hypothetical protein